MLILIHDLVIDVSQNNYTLMLDKHKTDKKGNPTYETLGYYNHLTNAVCAARDYCIRKYLADNVYSLIEAIDVIKRINEEFESLLVEKILK